MSAFDRDKYEFIENMKVLDVRPGDVICASTRTVLSEVAQDRLIHCIKEVFPDNRVVLLEDGMELGVMRPCGETCTDTQ